MEANDKLRDRPPELWMEGIVRTFPVEYNILENLSDGSTKSQSAIGQKMGMGSEEIRPRMEHMTEAGLIEDNTEERKGAVKNTHNYRATEKGINFYQKVKNSGVEDYYSTE